MPKQDGQSSSSQPLTSRSDPPARNAAVPAEDPPAARRAQGARTRGGRRTSGGTQPLKTEESPEKGPTKRPENATGKGAEGGPDDRRGGEAEMAVPAELSFQQARTALDLMIAELQSSDLEVEEMLNLYRRARAYADHCEAVLQQVDQDVIEWDVLQESRESEP